MRAFHLAALLVLTGLLGCSVTDVDTAGRSVDLKAQPQRFTSWEGIEPEDPELQPTASTSVFRPLAKNADGLALHAYYYQLYNTTGRLSEAYAEQLRAEVVAQWDSTQSMAAHADSVLAWLLARDAYPFFRITSVPQGAVWDNAIQFVDYRANERPRWHLLAGSVKLTRLSYVEPEGQLLYQSALHAPTGVALVKAELAYSNTPLEDLTSLGKDRDCDPFAYQLYPECEVIIWGDRYPEDQECIYGGRCTDEQECRIYGRCFGIWNPWGDYDDDDDGEGGGGVGGNDDQDDGSETGNSSFPPPVVNIIYDIKRTPFTERGGGSVGATGQYGYAIDHTGASLPSNPVTYTHKFCDETFITTTQPFPTRNRVAGSCKYDERSVRTNQLSRIWYLNRTVKCNGYIAEIVFNASIDADIEYSPRRNAETYDVVSNGTGGQLDAQCWP